MKKLTFQFQNIAEAETAKIAEVNVPLSTLPKQHALNPIMISYPKKYYQTLFTSYT